MIQIIVRKNKKKQSGLRQFSKISNNPDYFTLAGETRLEHATDGFGDRCSTIELLPLEHL